MKSHSDRRQKTLDFISKQRVITTSELASYLKVSWNTAEKYLLELALDGMIIRMKKRGVNLWVPK